MELQRKQTKKQNKKNLPPILYFKFVTVFLIKLFSTQEAFIKFPKFFSASANGKILVWGNSLILSKNFLKKCVLFPK